jgi:XisI protein
VDKIELYRASIQALLQEHNQHLPKNSNDVENELFFDVERDRYQLIVTSSDNLPSHANFFFLDLISLPCRGIVLTA